MNCKEFRELLDLYVDGELSPERLVAASAHLADCITCTRTRDELVRLRIVVKKVVLQHAPSPQLVREVNMLLGLKAGHVPGKKQDAFGPASESFLMISRRGRLSGLLKRRVAIPLPVLTVTVLVFTALGCCSFANLNRRSVTRTPGNSNVTSINPPLSPPPADTLDLSRFDHGSRATVVKVRRASTSFNAY